MKTKLTKTELHKLAHLARLTIDTQDEAKILDDLNEILMWVEKLDELDTEDVRPLIHISEEINVFRADKIGEHIDTEQAVSLAPKRKEQFFKVPPSF